MPLGTVVFSRTTYDAMLPEVIEQVHTFLSQGKDVQCTESAREYVYTLDHPDFLSELAPEVHYVLTFKRKYDAATNSMRPMLSELHYYDEVHAKVGLVKQYAEV